MEKIVKPKLVFFQWRYKAAPKFMVFLHEQHVKCLSEFFEVIVIDEDCDYQQICDEYQPDITLFESGIPTINSPCQRIVKNTSAYPEIPKLGLYNGDAFCGFHAAFFSDMERWGVETFFCIAVSMPEYLPEINDNLFVWPNFIDADIFRDYGQPKNIPVLITGSEQSMYPWRRRIHKIISQNYPSLICPHFGHTSERATSRMIHGEQYARTINASCFVPTCGTVAKEIIRKHLEVPGAKSCLITEKTPALEACGFVDMQNCVFADESDVLDKLDDLLQNPENLERITNAGYQLVQSRHTLKQRNQILEWFNLYKQLKPNQRIVQTSPFESLTIVESSSKIKNSPIIGYGLDRALLYQGDEKLFANKYDEAEALYLGCLNYINYQAEPKLRLALCNLYKGNAIIAHSWIVQPIKETLEIYKALNPDPVEWAYFIICHLCQGKLDDAIKLAEQYPSLYHPELEYVRAVVDGLKSRYSAHQMPKRGFNEWVDNLRIMLTACQQINLAKTLVNSITLEDKLLTPDQLLEVQQINFNNLAKDFKITPQVISSNWLTPLIKIIIQLKSSILGFAKKIIKKVLCQLERRFGFFLPYQISIARLDEFFSTIQKLAREEDIKSVILIGASAGEGSTEAILAGIQENKNSAKNSPNRSTVFCLNITKPRFVKLQKRYVNNSFVSCYNISSVSTEHLVDTLKDDINKIKQGNKIDYFDMVLIDSSEFIGIAELDLLDEVYGARFILLDDINTFENYKNHQRLLANLKYLLVNDNPSLRRGYAIFQKANIR